MLTALPNHERLIPSLCEYDLVGFQTGDDAFNFSRYLTRKCGLHSHDFSDRRIPGWHRNFGLRRSFPAFSAVAVRLRDASTAPMVRRIGRRSVTSTLPTVTRHLRGLYRAACVRLVTPLRDGMNLVAKEYVASQNPDDPGVLILSRFAGAAHECTAALLVNPYDPDSVASAIGQALSMPVAERRERHDALFRVLSHNDIQHWADQFLTAPERKPPARANALCGIII